MDINIVGICGSHRRGNTLKMIESSLEAAREIKNVSTDLIHLKNISHCIACKKCPSNQPGKICNLSDQMDEIYPKLIQCDGIIIGSPVYYGNVNSLTKAFIDRWRSLGKSGSLLKFKVGGAIAVGGCRHGGQEKTISTIIDSYLMSGICPTGLSYPPIIGACGVAFNQKDVLNDVWYHSTKNQHVSAIQEARQIGLGVALLSKIIKTGLKEVNVAKELKFFMSH